MGFFCWPEMRRGDLLVYRFRRRGPSCNIRLHRGGLFRSGRTGTVRFAVAVLHARRHRSTRKDQTMPDLFLYDTSLRDGAQMEGISYSADEKVAITRRLDELG